MSYFTVLLEEPICSTGSLRVFLENFDSEMGVAIEIDQHGETVLLVGDEFTVRMQLADVLEDRKGDGFIFHRVRFWPMAAFGKGLLSTQVV